MNLHDAMLGLADHFTSETVTARVDAHTGLLHIYGPTEEIRATQRDMVRHAHRFPGLMLRRIRPQFRRNGRTIFGLIDQGDRAEVRIGRSLAECREAETK